MDTGLWGPWVLALSPCPQVPLGSPVTVQVEGHGEGTLTVGGCMDIGVISKTDVPSQPPLVVSPHAATVSPAVPSWCHAVPRCSASSACCHLRTPRARRCTWRWPSPAPSCTMVRPHPKALPPFPRGGEIRAPNKGPEVRSQPDAHRPSPSTAGGLGDTGHKDLTGGSSGTQK